VIGAREEEQKTEKNNSSWRYITISSEGTLDSIENYLLAAQKEALGARKGKMENST